MASNFANSCENAANSSNEILFTTYKKRPGTINQGEAYEVLMCALYALRLSTDPNVVDFEITSNDDDCGSFDDVKLKVVFKNEEKIFLFQLKHRDNPKIITEKDLINASKNSDFTLEKYFNSLSKNVDKEAVCILSTNCSTNLYEDVEFSNGFSAEICDSVECGNLLLNSDGNNSVIKFKSSQDQEIYFFTCQNNLRKTEYVVRDLLENLFKCDIYNNFFAYMTEWSKGNYVLKKQDFIGKLTELALSPNLKAISGSKCNRKTDLLKNAIMEFELTIVKNEGIIENIWNNEENVEESIVKKIARKFGLTSEKPESKLLKTLWYMSKVPLIVEVKESNITSIEHTLKFLRPALGNKKIVLLGNVQRINFENWSIFENLFDLNEKCGSEKYFEELSSYLKLSLQGRQPLSLEQFRGIDPEISKIIGTEELLKMSQTDLVIGCKHEELPDFHIPRRVSPDLYDITELLKYFENKKSVVIFNCDVGFKNCLRDLKVVDLSDFLQDVRGNSKGKKSVIVLSTNDRCTREQFDTIRKTLLTDLYLFEIFDAKNCVLLLKSQNPGSNLSSKTTDKSTEEVQIMRYFINPINFICAPAGTGKTTLMKSLCNGCFQDRWAVYVKLIDYSEFLKNYSENETILSHFLKLDENTSQDCLTTNVKNILCRNKKIDLFLDGVDEVHGESIDLVLDFAKYASSKGLNVWISSRENLRERIFDRLKVQPIKIQEFENKEQQEYIRTKLHKKFQNEQVKKIESTIFNNVHLNKSQNILGSPLQLYLITEIFLKNDEVYKQMEQENIFLLTNLYRLYFDGLLTTNFNKAGLEEAKHHQLDIDFEQYLEQYEIPALKACLDESDYQKLQFGEKKLKKFLDRKRTGDKYGIIANITKENEIVFTHQSYAEYFAALWLKENKDKLKLLRDSIFSPKYDNLRCMLDIMFAERNPLHLSIIYQSEELFEKNMANVDDVDEGGRTALHLACCYGLSYSKYMTWLYFEVFGESEFTKKIINTLLTQDVKNQPDNLFDFNYVDYSLKRLNLYFLENLLDKNVLVFEEVKEELPKYIDVRVLAYQASICGYASLLLGIIKYHPELVNQDINGRYLLQAAINGGNCNPFKNPIVESYFTAKILLENGASLKSYRSALDDACEHFRYDIIPLLLEKGAKCSKGNTILHKTARHNVIAEYAIDLAKEFNININQQNDDGDTVLHVLCWKGNIKMIKYLHQNEPTIDFNIKNNNGKTAFVLACQFGRVEIAQYLLESGQEINVDNEGNTPLHNVVTDFTNVNKEIMYLLKNWGIDVDARNNIGKTALHIACSNGDLEVAKLLLEIGANINVLDNENNTPLHCAYDLKPSHLDVIFIVNVMRKLNEDAAVTPNYMAELVDFLLSNYSDPNIQNEKGMTALHLAAKRGQVEIAKKLIKKQANINAIDNQNKNALHYAYQSENVNTELINLLIDNEIDIEAKDRFDKTPLQLALSKGTIEIAKKLIQKGANLNILDRKSNNLMFYIFKSKNIDLEIIEMMIQNGFNVNIPNKYGTTPLHLACKLGHFEVAQLLIDSDADLNASDNENNNALHYACEKYHTDLKVLTKIIESGIDINQQNIRKRTALHIACRFSNLEVVKLLLEKGANPTILDNDLNDVFHYLASSKRPSIEKIDLLISLQELSNRKNKFGQTVLHVACKNGSVKTVQRLIQNGFDVNLVDNEGNSSLHCSVIASKQNHEMMKLWLDNGVDINIRNNNGETPLHLACNNLVGPNDLQILIDHKADLGALTTLNKTILYYIATSKRKGPRKIILEFFLEISCTVNHQDNGGKTVLHVACKEGNHDIVESLITHDVNVNVLDNKKSTALHFAVLANKLDLRIFDTLFKAKVDLRAKDWKNRDALDYAMAKNRNYAAMILLGRHAIVEKFMERLDKFLYYSVYSGFHHGVQMYLDGELEIPQVDVNDESFPLYFASNNGELRLDMLLKMSVFINRIYYRFRNSSVPYSRLHLIEYLKLQMSTNGSVDSIFEEVDDCLKFQQRFRDIQKFINKEETKKSRVQIVSRCSTGYLQCHSGIYLPMEVIPSIDINIIP